MQSLSAPPSLTGLRAMASADLDAVMAIEACAYAHPWSRGNFCDSLAAGHVAWVLETSASAAAGGPSLQAYCVAMRGVDEWHLLNITVAPPQQGQGLARALLSALVDAARADAAQRIVLEVRASNHRAQQVYGAFGFASLGLRRGYYPALRGQREDALVWALALEPAHAV